MGKSSGSADPSGMYAAMASERAAELSYQLGEQQLQWTQQVWNQEQPLIDAAEKQDIALAEAQQVSLEQMQQEAAQQWQMYQTYYAPLEEAYVAQAENWASPQNMAQVMGEAQAGVAENVQAGINTAAEQLRAYGVNPDAGKYAGMYTGANVMGAAAEAGAGTMAAQNLKLQQLALEQGAINTGRGVANATGQLTSAGTQAGQAGVGAASAAAGTAQSNLSTGAQAMTLPANWFNTGATNMGVFTNAVNAYNTNQLGWGQLAGEQAMGWGSLIGGIVGDMLPIRGLRTGGPVTKFDAGGPAQGAIPSAPNPSFNPWSQVNMQGPDMSSVNQARTGTMRPQAMAKAGAIPSEPVPSYGTPGGYVHHSQSPSGGRHVDDVPARLSAGEFVIPLDVVEHLGKQHFYNVIDKSRKQQKAMADRQDVGGEAAEGEPQRPTFQSVPAHMRQAIPLPV